jgi:hypothetical protein
MRVIRNIRIIIEVDEFVISDLPKGRKGYQNEKETNKEWQNMTMGQ